MEPPMASLCMTRVMTWMLRGTGLLAGMAMMGAMLGSALGAQPAFQPVDTQTSGQPPSARESMSRLRLPDGFKLTLAAGEPEVRQPPALRKRFEELWGSVNLSSAAVAAQVKRLRATMKPDFLALGDVGHGRGLFEQRCAACHALFGKGATLAPDLTGSGRKEIEYLITNIVDPNAAIAADWRLTAATTQDGRVVSGSLAQESAAAVTFRTTDGPVTLERAQIKSL